MIDAFLNPALLAGAALAAVPIVLHLLMRPKPRSVEFPALRLLALRKEANQRRLRVRHLLLLALRAAVIVLLALALARPSVRSGGLLADQAAPVAAAMVIDTAPRMQYRHQNQTRLEVAQDTALWLVAELPADSQVAVLDARAGEPVFQVDLGAARQRIERLETTAAARPLAERIESAARLLADSPLERREVYVFTDLSRGAWQRTVADELRAALEAVDGLAVYVIDVGVAAPQNFALGELRLSGQVLSRNTPLRVSTELIAVGSAGQRTVELVMAPAGGTPERRNQDTVEVAAGEARRLEFPVGGLEPGTYQGQLQIVGGDGLTADNTRYFTIEVKPAWQVLVVAPRPAAEQAFLLTEALAPEEFRRQGQARFECTVIEEGQLAEQSLERFAAVALIDPSPLEAGASHRLAAWVAEGGGLVLAVGGGAQPADRFNAEAAELLPAPLTQIRRQRVFLAPSNYQHLLLERFRPFETGIPWDDLPVYRYWQLGDLPPAAAVVIPYSDGAPALVERPVGRGRVLLLTTPIAASATAGDWNRLPTGIELEPWPFVVLVNEMLLYLVGSSEEQLNYRVGATASVRLDASTAPANYVLITPRGDRLRRPVDARQRAIVVSSTEWPGHYRILAGGEQERLDTGFSVNMTPDMTDLERVDPGELDALFGETAFQLARGRDEIRRELHLGRAGRELYPFLILLVVTVLAAEQVVANRFYRQKQVPVQGPIEG